MKINKYAFLFLSLLFIFSAILQAYSDPIKVEIRYYDKKIYYTNQPVQIKLEISNNSPETFRFKSSDLRAFNYEFEVKTLTNRRLEHSSKFTMDRGSNQQVFFREISLAPGENYSIIMNLADFIEIKEAGVFIMNVRFYPELYTSPSAEYVVSNNLTLNMRPAASSKKIQDIIDSETGEILKETRMPPDEVVKYMLEARQKSQMDKFLLYINLEKLYMRNEMQAARYIRLSQEDRILDIEEYKNMLLSGKIDTDISIIPSEFSILRTEYTEYDAKVKVLEKFRYESFVEIKEYTYYLHRNNNIWYIIDYEVRNMGTE